MELSCRTSLTDEYPTGYESLPYEGKQLRLNET
jgi:hypothetical protein